MSLPFGPSPTTRRPWAIKVAINSASVSVSQQVYAVSLSACACARQNAVVNYLFRMLSTLGQCWKRRMCFKLRK